MTLHGKAHEVGVRDLHDRLSEHLARVADGAEIVVTRRGRPIARVADGAEIVVTRRGRPIARLSAIDAEDPLDELVRRGLVTPPKAPRQRKAPRVTSQGSVSDLVAEQRR